MLFTIERYFSVCHHGSGLKNLMTDDGLMVRFPKSVDNETGGRRRVQLLVYRTVELF